MENNCSLHKDLQGLFSLLTDWNFQSAWGTMELGFSILVKRCKRAPQRFHIASSDLGPGFYLRIAMVSNDKRCTARWQFVVWGCCIPATYAFFGWKWKGVFPENHRCFMGSVLTFWRNWRILVLVYPEQFQCVEAQALWLWRRTYPSSLWAEGFGTQHELHSGGIQGGSQS